MTVAQFASILMLAVSNVFMTFVFVGYSNFWLMQAISWMTAAGFGFIALGAAFVFKG